MAGVCRSTLTGEIYSPPAAAAPAPVQEQTPISAQAPVQNTAPVQQPVQTPTSGVPVVNQSAEQQTYQAPEHGPTQAETGAADPGTSKSAEGKGDQETTPALTVPTAVQEESPLVPTLLAAGAVGIFAVGMALLK